MVKYLLLLTLVAAVTARTANTAQNKLEGRSSDDNILGDLKLAYETYKDCSGSDISHCLKRKLAKTLSRLTKAEELNILNGVTITKDKDVQITEKEEAIPRGMDEGSLNNLILDKVVNFMRSHTLQVKFPTEDETDALSDQGRSRRKKLAPLLAIPLLIGGMMVPLAFGALALLAGKALIVSKLALVLAGIIGLKKLLSPSGGGHEAHEVVVSAGHSGSGWSRSLEKSSHDLAYNAYAQ
ncbi:hypothetical protein HW555_008393 [Spodoptera exigua]|uniref:Osiris 8 n=1 Tax=Spodoptera exigua TaxID=7107 RepID=A0A835GE22_SPOEX|nr:hypothetical protein HW555_008393 [Spodoptera exigua]KAH9644663.1 hypothetical protein HF086_011832 [Spodoptera exigua]